MTLPCVLLDRDTEAANKVDKHGSIHVSILPNELSASGVTNRYRFYHEQITGMNVNGSVTPVDFSVGAHLLYDIFINTLIIVVGDSAVTHSNFGALSALSVGWDLKVLEYGNTTYLVEKAKTGGQLLVKSGLYESFGTGADVGELVNWTGTQDAQVIKMRLNDIIPGGFRIGRGTQDKLIATVNDNLTGLDTFTIDLFGYYHIA